MITWVRPSGTEITTNDNDATVAYARSLGWKLKEEKKKPGRPKKDAE